MLRSCSQENNNKLGILSNKKRFFPYQKIIRVNIATKTINSSSLNNTNTYSFPHTNSKKTTKKIDEKNKIFKKTFPKPLTSRKTKTNDISNYSTNITNFNKKNVNKNDTKSRIKTPNSKPSSYSATNTENKKNNIILITNINANTNNNINNTNSNTNTNANTTVSNSKAKKLLSNSCLMTDNNINDILNSDNFEKELLTKYLDGTENMINEDLESFTGSNDSNSFNNVDEIKTERKKTYMNSDTFIIGVKTEKLKNYKKIIPRNSNLKFSTITEIPFLNSHKKNKTIKFFNNKNKKIINNLKNKEKNELLKHSNNINITKLKDKYKNNQKTKLINIKKFFRYRGNSTINRHFCLDIILEQKQLFIKKNIHHYLENTVSAKNKMVHRKLDITPNFASKRHSNKITINEENEKKNNEYTTLYKLTNTPHAIRNYNMDNSVKIDMKKLNLINFNTNVNNLDYAQRIFRNRKYSHLKRELSSEQRFNNSSYFNNSKLFNGKLDKYNLTKELGRGSYAIVRLAVEKKTKNKFAIKIYRKQNLLDPQKKNVVKNEIDILKQLDNEYIMKLYEVIDTPSNLYLVLEYIKGISLLDVIKKEKKFYIEEERAIKIFKQVVKGVSYCQKKNIYHRDIKLENILIMKGDIVKIIDFGFSIKCNKYSYQKLFCGTPSYMPPEIVKKEKYLPYYSDIWSLGVLFFAMLFGRFPFMSKDEDELFEKIIEAKLIFPENIIISEKSKNLFKKIFVLNPVERPSFDEIINMIE